MFVSIPAAQSGLAALEVRPGVLLRISTSSTDKLFAEAAQDLDPVGTAGHMVSIVVADGVANAPAALLANHMESSLAPAVTQEGLQKTFFIHFFFRNCSLTFAF